LRDRGLLTGYEGAREVTARVPLYANRGDLLLGGVSLRLPFGNLPSLELLEGGLRGALPAAATTVRARSERRGTRAAFVTLARILRGEAITPREARERDAVVVVAAMLRSVVNELSAFRDSWQLSRDISKIRPNFAADRDDTFSGLF
jgi:hypothetical protein